LQLKFTRHGPVLWEDGKHALALRWIGTEPGTVPYLAALSVDRAKNWKEYLSAMQRWKSPPENLVYADREGNIGEQSAGLTPVREGWTGLLPVPGASGLEWSGFVPLDQLPRQFNPTAGFYATANNKTTPDNYPYAVGFNWSETRVERINEVLGQARDARKKLSVADMEDLQNDVMSLPARELMPLLRGALAKQPEFDDSSAKAGKLLLDWDCRVSADSAAAALYEVWNHNLSSQMTRQITEIDADDEINVPPGALLRMLTQPTAEALGMISGGWKSGTNKMAAGMDPETARDNLILGSLSSAWEELAKLEGPDSTQWSWGKLHGVSWHHPLDKSAQWAGILDPSGVARPGDGNTVDATSGARYAQTHGASYREIFDLSDWDHSVAIDVPGESGQPRSPHYANLLPLWAKGEYFPLLYTRWEVEKHAPERLELRP
jgi:penicillin amidase